MTAFTTAGHLWVAPLAAVMVVGALLPWRRMLRHPPARPGSAAWSWRVLGLGLAIAAIASAVLQVVDTPKAVAVLVPLVLILPTTILGGWGAVVRPAASVETVLDMCVVAPAILLIFWAWILSDLNADPLDAAATLMTLGVILLVSGMAVASAIRDRVTRVELSSVVLGLMAFAVALLVPADGIIGESIVPWFSWGGYCLVLFAVVRGQLGAPSHRTSRSGEPLGGTAVAAALVVGALVTNAVVTELERTAAHPVEAGLQTLLLLMVAARVYVASRSWRRAHAEMDRVAHTDPLTGLHNRKWLAPRLDALMGGDGHAPVVSVLLIDLDRFKRINDSLGHRAGDAVLVEAGRRLRGLCGPEGVVRFGGDEFLVVVPRTADPHRHAEAVRVALCTPIAVDGRDLPMSASVGLASADEGTDPEVLIRHADAALYRAKELGRDRVVAYDAQLRGAAFRRLAIENGLRQAVDDGSLSLRYQPVVDARSGRLTAVEALLRWSSPALGPVGPADFIGVAEEIGAIVPIGRWVVDRVCADLAHLDQVLGEGTVPRVSINVSGVQLLAPGLVADIRRSLAAHGLAPDRVVIEVTESALLDPTGPAAGALRAFSDAGFLLAIDDFGTGFSALSYLEAFPVDLIKIDRSFVRPLGATAASGGEDQSLIPTLVRIAELLDMRLIAEGVEDAVQRDILLAMGCDLHQGYHYSRPVELDTLIQLVRTPVQA